MGRLLELNSRCQACKAHILHFYEPLFDPIVNRVESICEIGVNNGASLQLWKLYFPNIKTIVGVDLQMPRFKHDTEMVLIRGDIMIPGIRDQVIERGPYDIIIDDASHFSKQFIPTFHSLLDSAKLFYVIEDIGMDASKGQLADFIKEESIKLQHLDRNIAWKVEDIPDAKISSITVYHGLLVFEKIWRYPPKMKHV